MLIYQYQKKQYGLGEGESLPQGTGTSPSPANDIHTYIIPQHDEPRGDSRPIGP